jgi:hypothetical protein
MPFSNIKSLFSEQLPVSNLQNYWELSDKSNQTGLETVKTLGASTLGNDSVNPLLVNSGNIAPAITLTPFDSASGAKNLKADSLVSPVFAGLAARFPGRQKDLFTSTGETGDASLDYNVTIQFKGSLWSSNPTLRLAFENAANLISQIITDDLGHDTTIPFFPGIGLNTQVDDIYLTAELTDIDGEGGVLGQAGPQLISGTTQLTLVGLMEFDVADGANFDAQGLFDDIVFHEMLHTLGFGTLWDYGDRDLINNNLFNGDNAVDAYNLTYAETAAYDPLTAITVEDDGGGGTAGGHWEEGPINAQPETRVSFDNEIMTGYINDSNYLSTMTIASLQDLGYETVWSELYADYVNNGTDVPLVYENSLLTGSPDFV